MQRRRLLQAALTLVLAGLLVWLRMVISVPKQSGEPLQMNTSSATVAEKAEPGELAGRSHDDPPQDPPRTTTLPIGVPEFVAIDMLNDRRTAKLAAEGIVISDEQRDALQRLCTETWRRLLGQFALYAEVSEVDTTKREAYIRLPQSISAELEKQFLEGVDSIVGRDVRTNQSFHDRALAWATAQMADFGRNPLLFSLSGLDASDRPVSLQNSERFAYELATLHGNSREPAIGAVGGVSTLSGSRAMYGSLIDRLLFGVSRPRQS